MGKSELVEYEASKKQDFTPKNPILTCGNCAGELFYIAQNGAVACEKCRCLMVPTPWDKVPETPQIILED